MKNWKEPKDLDLLLHSKWSGERGGVWGTVDDVFKIAVLGKPDEAKGIFSPARYTYHGAGRRVNDRVCLLFIFLDHECRLLFFSVIAPLCFAARRTI